MKVWVGRAEDAVLDVWTDIEAAKDYEMERCIRVTDNMYGDKIHYRQWQCYQGTSWSLYFKWEDDNGKHSAHWISFEEREVK